MDATDLVRTLKARGGYEVVHQSGGVSQMRFIGRVPAAMLPNWWIIVDRLLAAQGNWTVDISKQYFRESGKVRYCWRVIFQAPDVAQNVQDICSVITSAPRAQAIIEEMPLPGVSGNRNDVVSHGGRGAQGVLNAVVGPAALAMRARGAL